MSHLEDLEKKLYREGEAGEDEIEKRTKQQVIFRRTQEHPPVIWNEPTPEEPAGPKRPQKLSRKLIALIIGGGVVFLILLGLGMWFLLRSMQHGQEASLAISGRSGVESGELLTLPIEIKNTSAVALRDVEVALTLPDGSLIRQGETDSRAPVRFTQQIDDLNPNEQRTVPVIVRLFGMQDEEKGVEASITYRPANSSARFSIAVSKSYQIIGVPLGLFWDIPSVLSAEQDVTITVRYASNARNEFDNLWLRLQYPPGFTFTRADPAPNVENNYWNIGLLQPGQEGTIVLHGRITGDQGDQRGFRGALGVYEQATKKWTQYLETSYASKIETRLLAIEPTAPNDGVLASGEDARFNIRYQNNTVLPLHNVVIRAFIEGDRSVIKPETLTYSNEGVFDVATQQVVWSGANVPQLQLLQPNASGEFTIGIRLHDPPVVQDATDVNPRIRLHTFISVQDPPPGYIGTDFSSQKMVEAKVATKVQFDSVVLYRNSPIENTGPLPPRVGEKTTYTIVWSLRTFTSDIKNIVIESSLPTNVQWEGKVVPENSQITYIPNQKTIRWKIDKIPAGTGVRTPAYVGAFQVSVVPSQFEIKQPLDLVRPLTLKAVDGFTDAQVSEKSGVFSTQLHDDPTTTAGDWLVVP